MQTPFDVAIVGAGIVGLATARELLERRPGASVIVLEREPTVAAHQTGHNSGVIHGGVYYTPGSLKARLCVEGAAMMYEFAQEHGIDHSRCGKLIVAVDRSELGRLDELERRGHANGVPRLTRVDAAGIADIEPNATGIAALHAPQTGIIDYAQVCEVLKRELQARDVTFRFGTRVTRIEDSVSCRIETTRGPIRARRVIVCAGLWSDRLARRSGAPSSPRIVPFRGVYLRLRKTPQPVVRGMVYPVPDPALPFLGVHVTSHVSGHVMLGPTAMLVPSRDGYLARTVRPRDVWETATWPGTWRIARRYWRTGIDELMLATSRARYVAAAARYIPDLTVGDLDGSFHSGVRAQAVDRRGTLVDDFAISYAGAVVHVRNAPSPAATSALAIARELLDRIDAAQ